MIKWTGRLLRIGAWLAFALLLLMSVLPLVTSTIIRYGVHLDEGWAAVALKNLTHLQFATMQMFFWGWIFFLGGCIASFLNVVAWRVPRGQSILGSSHCPKCDTKLDFRSNLPVFGWFRNDGKCSHCQVPIPPRYLIAELVLGTVFLVLFLRETVSGGVPIPFRTPNHFVGIENTVFDPKWDLIASLAAHLVLLSLLFTLAIIRSEKMPIPLSIWAVAVILAIASLIAPGFPGIVDWNFSASKWLSFGIESLKALGVALVAAGGAAMVVSLAKLENLRDGFLAFSLVGMFLGWQSVLSVLLLGLLLASLVVTVGHLVPSGLRSRVWNLTSPTMVVFVGTLLHLCFWQQQRGLSFWPAPGCDLRACLFSAVVSAGIAGTIRLWMNRREQMTPSAAF